MDLTPHQPFNNSFSVVVLLSVSNFVLSHYGYAFSNLFVRAVWY